jgi:predicted ester cyclase
MGTETSKMSIPERFVLAFGNQDWSAFEELYASDALLYAPTAWRVGGRDAILRVAKEFHIGFPGLKINLHDEFANADGTRVVFRYAWDWHNAGPFLGHPPTGRRGTTTETHTLRLRDGRIIEQVVGHNNLVMAHMALVLWEITYPQSTPDPAPAIRSAGQ